MLSRRKISASLGGFLKATRRLRSLDSQVQGAYLAGFGGGRGIVLQKWQAYLVAEGVFISLFTSFENFLEEVFLLYCMERPNLSGEKPTSFLKPRSYQHAAEMIKSSQPFLDWASPDTVIDRCKVYLLDGMPVKNVLTTNLTMLRDLKKIRNHISHRSRESEMEYIKVLRRNFKTTPARIPGVGEFLLMDDPHNVGSYFLNSFFDFYEKIAADITR